jgi:uncharacterized protein (UPF0305 family)
MMNKFVNERTIMILTSVGLFYYLYTKYLELRDRQDYLERNVVRVVEHLNKLTIDQVVREVSDDDEGEVDSTTVEVGNDSDSDGGNQVRVQSDAEFSYIHSDEPLDAEDEDFDNPQEAPEDETIIIGSNKNVEQVKGTHCGIILHSGKRKGFVCGKPAVDGFCGVHKNKAPKPQDDTPLDRMGDSNVVDM